MAKCNEVLRVLLRNGWYVERTGKGSHIILKHPNRKDFISFPNHGSMELAKGTQRQILKKAGIKL